MSELEDFIRSEYDLKDADPLEVAAKAKEVMHSQLSPLEIAREAGFQGVRPEDSWLEFGGKALESAASGATMEFYPRMKAQAAGMRAGAGELLSSFDPISAYKAARKTYDDDYGATLRRQDELFEDSPLTGVATRIGGAMIPAALTGGASTVPSALRAGASTVPSALRAGGSAAGLARAGGSAAGLARAGGSAAKSLLPRAAGMSVAEGTLSGLGMADQIAFAGGSREDQLASIAMGAGGGLAGVAVPAAVRAGLQAKRALPGVVREGIGSAGGKLTKMSDRIPDRLKAPFLSVVDKGLSTVADSGALSMGPSMRMGRGVTQMAQGVVPIPGVGGPAKLLTGMKNIVIGGGGKKLVEAVKAGADDVRTKHVRPARYEALRRLAGEKRKGKVPTRVKEFQKMDDATLLEKLAEELAEDGVPAEQVQAVSAAAKQARAGGFRLVDGEAILDDEILGVSSPWDDIPSGSALNDVQAPRAPWDDLDLPPRLRQGPAPVPQALIEPPPVPGGGEIRAGGAAASLARSAPSAPAVPSGGGTAQMRAAAGAAGGDAAPPARNFAGTDLEGLDSELRGHVSAVLDSPEAVAKIESGRYSGREIEELAGLPRGDGGPAAYHVQRILRGQRGMPADQAAYEQALTDAGGDTTLAQAFATPEVPPALLRPRGARRPMPGATRDTVPDLAAAPARPRPRRAIPLPPRDTVETRATRQPVPGRTVRGLNEPIETTPANGGPARAMTDPEITAEIPAARSAPKIPSLDLTGRAGGLRSQILEELEGTADRETRDQLVQMLRMGDDELISFVENYEPSAPPPRAEPRAEIRKVGKGITIEHEPIDGAGFTARATDRNGRVLGRVQVTEETPGVFTVYNAEVKDPGKGLGTAIYEDLLRWAGEKGVWLRPDTNVSESARALWRKLSRRQNVTAKDTGTQHKHRAVNFLDHPHDAPPEGIDVDAARWTKGDSPWLYKQYRIDP